MANFIFRLRKLQQNRYIFQYIYRLYKYQLYPHLTRKVLVSLVCTNSFATKYELVYKSLPKVIMFNQQPIDVLEYNQNRGYIWVPNANGKLKLDSQEVIITSQKQKQITEDSIIIITDRFEKADDNGEFFYKWVQEHKHSYKNVYFALSSNSRDFKRLSDAGYKLLDVDSKQFRNLYSKADVIVSSVYADYIENHKRLRYKYDNHPTSKFICLQHGVIFAKPADNELNSRQKINYLITSLDFEQAQFDNSKIWDKRQLPVIGMSRIISEVNHSEQDAILFMPTWTEQAYAAEKIEETEYYMIIEELLSSEVLSNYLSVTNKSFKVVIHPQLRRFIKSFKKLATSNIEVVSGEEIVYKDEIANCSLLVTDISSIFFDGLFRQKKVVFYHDPRGEYQSSRFTQFGRVSTNPCELVDCFESDQEKDKIDIELADPTVINEKIWELIVHG